MRPFVSAVVGVSHGDRQHAVRRCVEGQVARAVHEPENAVDPRAMAVYGADERQLGYLPAPLAHRLIDEYGPGLVLEGRVTEVLSGRGNWGVRVALTPPDAPAPLDEGDLGEWALDPSVA